MAATAFVRVRIDETLKNEATAVLAGMGLTVSDVVRIALTKIAKEPLNNSAAPVSQGWLAANKAPK